MSLDFEKEIADIEKRISELSELKKNKNTKVFWRVQASENWQCGDRYRLCHHRT